VVEGDLNMDQKGRRSLGTNMINLIVSVSMKIKIIRKINRKVDIIMGDTEEAALGMEINLKITGNLKESMQVRTIGRLKENYQMR
jgi:hypothetical protein